MVSVRICRSWLQNKQFHMQLFQTNIYCISFCGSGVQEQLGRVIWLLICDKAEIRLLGYWLELPSSQGWIGGAAASKVTQVVVGKIQLLACHWSQGLCSSLGYCPETLFCSLLRWPHCEAAHNMATHFHQREQVRARQKSQSSET